MNPARAIPAAVLLLVAAGLFPGSPLPLEGQQEPSVVFLVRHAEKADAPAADPPLTGEGQERARALAHVLDSVELDHLHSTDTRRTRATAAPVRRRTGLPLRIYDGDALRTLSRDLRSTPGRHLVVGHSDTTPELVRLLGGDPGSPIEEAWEYDRLYVITIRSGEPVSSLLLRYGEPARP